MGKSPGWAYFYDHRGLPGPARPSVTAFQTRLLNLAAGLWQCRARSCRRLWHLSGEWVPKPGTSRDGRDAAFHATVKRRLRVAEI
jgi:hypothetical protein